jgi:sugar (pentulose or hexulose) kinase
MVFDSGSKVVKCVIAESSGKIRAMEQITPEIIKSDDGFSRNYNVKTFWPVLLELVKHTISQAKVTAKEIRYITACCIRPSSIYADENAQPLHIGTSFDLRGINSVGELEDQFQNQTGRSFYEITGHNPALLFAPANLAAFREQLKEKDEDINRLQQYFSMDSWLLTRMGAEPHISYSAAAESGFFDLHHRCWHEAWTDILDLPDYFLPFPVQSGEIVGSVSEEMQKELGFSPETELVAGLPDTQAALLGCNCIHTGDIAAALGSTTPVQGLTSKLYLDPNGNTWAGLMTVKNITDCYYVETNTGITGQIVKWGAQLFAHDPQASWKEKFQRLDLLFQQYDEEEQKISAADLMARATYAFLGPSALASNSTGISPGIFYFPTPGGPDEMEMPPNRMVGALFDNIQFAITKNIEYNRNVLRTLGEPERSTTIVGGITRNPTLCQRFADTLNVPLQISTDPECTIQGLLTLCRIAGGEIKSIDDVIPLHRTHIKQLSPRAEMKEKMQLKCQQWELLKKKFTN